MREETREKLLRQPAGGTHHAVVFVGGLCVLAAGLYLTLFEVRIPASPYLPLLVVAVGLTSALDGEAESLPGGWNRLAGTLRTGAFLARLGAWIIVAVGVVVWLLS